MKRNKKIVTTAIVVPIASAIAVNAQVIINPLVAKAAEYGMMMLHVQSAKKLMVLIVFVTIRGQLIATVRRWLNKR